MQLGGADADGARSDGLAHLALVVPEVDELVGRLGRDAVHREVAADGKRRVGQRAQHMGAELLGDLAAHLGGDVGVAVAVGADPAAGVEERGADGRHGAGLVAELPVVEATVNLGHHLEQRAVEDVDDGVGLLDGGRLLVRDGARAEERVDLLQQAALVVEQGDAAQALVLLEQAGDAANLALDGLAAGLGGVRSEHGVELKAVKKGVGLAAAALVDELVVGNGEVVDRVVGVADGNLALALAQRLDAVVLLTGVGEVEERDERAHEQRGVLVVELGDDGRHVLEGLVLLRVLVGIVVHQDCVKEQDVEDGAEVLVGLLEDFADQAQEKRHVVPDLIRNVDALERLERRGLLDGELLLCQRVSLLGATAKPRHGLTNNKIPRLPPADKIKPLAKLSVHGSFSGL